MTQRTSILSPFRRSRAFSLLPDFEQRRAQFLGNFSQRGDQWRLTYKNRSYSLSQRAYRRAVVDFDEVIGDMEVAWRKQILSLFAGSIIGVFVYFSFVDSLVAMLPDYLQSPINAILLFQPILWAIGMAVRQEQRVNTICDGIVARAQQHAEITGYDDSEKVPINWVSLGLQGAGLAALIVTFGPAFFDALTG
ncbi:MAG: hypothetical protein ABL882_07585 [Sphingopyxis sp.]